MASYSIDTARAKEQLESVRVPSDQASVIVDLLAQSHEQVASKSDIEQLSMRIDHLEKSTKADNANLEASMKADNANLEASTKAAIANLEASTKAAIANLEASMKADNANLEASTKADIEQLEMKIEHFAGSSKTDMDLLEERLGGQIKVIDAKFEGLKSKVTLWGVGAVVLAVALVKALDYLLPLLFGG